MIDKITPQDQKQVTHEEGKADPTIFDKRFDAVMDPFGNSCTSNNITTAVAIVIHPEETRPMVFVRGHEYDAAALLAKVLRALKTNLFNNLET